MGLTIEQRESWDERGFFIIRGFAEQNLVEEMIVAMLSPISRSDGGRSQQILEKHTR